MEKLNNIPVAIAAEAQRWVNLKVPHTHQGNSIRGCDCLGFLTGVAGSVLHRVWKVPYYPEDWIYHTEEFEILLRDGIKETGFELMEKTILRYALIGDVILFKFGRYKCHAGFFLGGAEFAHCTDAGCRIDTLIGSQWTKRLKEIWRYDR